MGSSLCVCVCVFLMMSVFSLTHSWSEGEHILVCFALSVSDSVCDSVGWLPLIADIETTHDGVCILSLLSFCCFLVVLVQNCSADRRFPTNHDWLCFCLFVGLNDANQRAFLLCGREDGGCKTEQNVRKTTTEAEDEGQMERRSR